MNYTREAVARAEKAARASTGCTNEVAATFAREFLSALEAEGFEIARKASSETWPCLDCGKPISGVYPVCRRCAEIESRAADPGAAAMRDQPL